VKHGDAATPVATLAGTSLCFLSMGMLVPVLPQYLTRGLGQGLGMVGIVVAVPSVTAIVVRPLAGRLVDQRGYRLASVTGAGLLALAALVLALPGADAVPGVLVCRATAGVGEALAYVGFAAASIPASRAAAPKDRAAAPTSAITWFSIAVYAGLLAGAPLGTITLTWSGFRTVWLLDALPALAAAGCGLMLSPRTRTTQSRADTSHPYAGRPPLVHPAGLRPGVAYGASVWGYTAFNTFIPLYVAALGGRDARIEYLLYGTVLLGVRGLGHRLIGRLQPRRAGIAALTFTVAGLLGLALWPGPGPGPEPRPGLIGGTVLLAIGQALGLPAFLTAALNEVPAGQKGSVLATVTGFFDVGFLTSALGLGAINELFGLRSGFIAAAAIPATALLLFIPRRRAAPPTRPHVRRKPVTTPSPDIPAADLTAYADVVLDIGTPVREDDLVVVNAEIDHAPLARALAEGAYARGARYVDIWYFDPHAKRSRIRHADQATLAETPSWLDHRNTELGERRGVLINIRGEAEPDLLSDVDPARAGLDRMPGLSSRYRLQANDLVCWTIVAYPSPAWARQVFGEPDVPRLWQHLKHFLRLDQPDPRAAWRARLGQLKARAAQLDELNLDAVHFAGPGTDLTVGLIPRAGWGAVGYHAADGRYYVPCLPSEEVYTAPDYRRVEGTVRSTRPLSLAGTVIRDLELTFTAGRVSEVRARTGADVVRGHQATDHGAARLGELALVDGSSPIGQSGITFMETLLDENATCHLAWGFGIKQAIPGASQLSPGELDAMGLNASAVHTDFMVGGPDVTVTGIRHDGSHVVLLRDEQWQLTTEVIPPYVR
jgi:aminopeptidase